MLAQRGRGALLTQQLLARVRVGVRVGVGVRVRVGVGVGVGARVRVRVRVRVCGAAPRLGRHDGAREVEQRTHVRRARALGRRSEGGEPGLHLEVKIDGVHMAGGRTVLWWVGGKMAKEESPGFTWSGEW